MCGYVPPQGVQPRIRNINQIINRRHADLQQLYIQDHFTNWRNARDFPTVQDAINDLAGAGLIYVPIGTFNEVLTITNNDVILQGCGWGSIINGGTVGNAITVTGSRCFVRDLQAKTTRYAGTNYKAIAVAYPATDCVIANCYTSQSDKQGIIISYADDCLIIGSYIYNCDNEGIYLNQAKNSRVIGNHVRGVGGDGIFIDASSANCVVDGNRIRGWVGEAIDDDSGTSTIGDNDTTV